MTPSRILLIFMVGMLISASPAATEQLEQENWQKICGRVKNVFYPPADLPTTGDARALKDCSSYNLYYGFVEKANPVKARLCAYGEKKDLGDSPFYGKAMLMTIYANGIGAKRNLDLALKLACEVGGAPAEIEGRVKHLAELKAKNWQGSDFSFCDDITSGYMQGFCADHHDQFASVKRNERLGEIQGKWTKADRKAFAELSKIADNYFDVHVDQEVDQTGSGRAALAIGELAVQKDFFLKTLEELDRGTLPQYSVHQFRAADSQLNTVYQQIQKKTDLEWGSVTKEGIKIAQRSWVKYRDAWIKFCSKKYPGITAERISTHLTLNRVKELEEF
ncbi:MAG: DUF1311 domain-containing protein [Deltaproteobacteria bacterium]